MLQKLKRNELAGCGLTEQEEEAETWCRPVNVRLPDKRKKVFFLRNVGATVPGFNRNTQGTSQTCMFSFIDSTGLNTRYLLSLFCIYWKFLCFRVKKLCAGIPRGAPEKNVLKICHQIKRRPGMMFWCFASVSPSPPLIWSLWIRPCLVSFALASRPLYMKSILF